MAVVLARVQTGPTVTTVWSGRLTELVPLTRPVMLVGLDVIPFLEIMIVGKDWATEALD